MDSHDIVTSVGHREQRAGEKQRQRGGVMELRSRSARTFHRSRPVVPCAQCGVTLFAPEWSEYIDDRRIRHLWSCDACGYEFESEVCYPAPATQAA